MFYRSDDPYADFLAYSASQEDELENLPICAECGEPIVGDDCWDVDGGKWICEDCLNENHCIDIYDTLDDDVSENDLEKLPVCAECGAPIVGEFCWNVGNGRIVCEDCLDEVHCIDVYAATQDK